VLLRWDGGLRGGVGVGRLGFRSPLPFALWTINLKSVAASGERERAEGMRKGYLSRLGPRYYRGHATIHWTLTIDKRATGWLDLELHARWREVLLHACVRSEVICPAYRPDARSHAPPADGAQ